MSDCSGEFNQLVGTAVRRFHIHFVILLNRKQRILNERSDIIHQESTLFIRHGHDIFEAFNSFKAHTIPIPLVISKHTGSSGRTVS